MKEEIIGIFVDLLDLLDSKNFWMPWMSTLFITCSP